MRSAGAFNPNSGGPPPTALGSSGLRALNRQELHLESASSWWVQENSKSEVPDSSTHLWLNMYMGPFEGHFFFFLNDEKLETGGEEM